MLADKFGHQKILLAGYGVDATTAILTALAFLLRVDSVIAWAGIFLFAGIYVAVQEVLESTVTAEWYNPIRSL